MSRFICLLIGLFLAIVSSAHAETYPLGAGVALKVEYFHFSDSTIGDLNADDGVFVGIEAYKQLFLPNLYLGLEVGWAGTSGSLSSNITTGQFDPVNGNFTFVTSTVNVDNDISYVPIEFNAKYVIPVNPCWNVHFGAGASANYFNLDTTVSIPVNGTRVSASSDQSDWVFGGQFFAGVDYKYQNWFAGLGVKYQLTQDIDISVRSISILPDTSADNLRVGLKVGYMF
jgi:opacity protein-like surface antigen